ncbi:MAG: hypothetical protein LCH93_16750 [Proteobacteria bacterium]|nr:hypothetical protein [Pseudomonadota bacterium]
MSKGSALKAGLVGLAVIAGGVGVAHSAKAQEEIGCTVLLCMLNPAGPYAVPICAAAVSNYFAMAATMVSLPACMAAGWSGGNPGYDPVVCGSGYGASQDASGTYGCLANEATVKLDEFGQPVPDGNGSVLMERQFTMDPSVMTYRDKAHYFDLPVNGQTRRIWF